MDLVADLITRFDPAISNFPPTDLYRKSWLLKALLYRIAEAEADDFPLAFRESAAWFTNALLPTPFAARYPGDPHADSKVRVDGVIGQVFVSGWDEAVLKMGDNASQLVVVQATLGEPLKPGPANAPYFDGPSRVAAGIAQLMADSGVDPAQLDQVSLVLLAPSETIKQGIYQQSLQPAAITRDVERKARSYQGRFDQWMAEWFEPTMDELTLESLSWQSAFDWLRTNDSEAAEFLQEFYQQCLSWVDSGD